MAGANVWRVGGRVLVRGARWRIDGVTIGEDCHQLQLTDVGSSPTRTLAILTPFDRPVSIERTSPIRIVGPRKWLHDLDRALLEVHPFGSLAATVGSAISLRPYQLEPALAVLRHGASRVLIADAVGLGKTIQAGVILRELSARNDACRALVLVPAGLRDQWSRELASHFGIPAIVADAVWLRRTTSERPASVNPWALPGIYIASHDFVKRAEALRPLEGVSWDAVVVDEAHGVTSNTDRRAAIDAIASRALRVVLLTATPPAGDARELAALCRIGRASQAEERPLLFARTKADAGSPFDRKTLVLPVAPSEAEMRMHRLLERYSTQVWKEAAMRGDEQARLASVVLRKRALSSAGSLAVSVQRRLELLASRPRPDAEQLSLPLADEDPLTDDEPLGVLAAPGLADPRRERRWLGGIAEAARAAARNETKMRRLLRLLARIREPVIVFTEYRDTLGRLLRRIEATGRSVTVLHGGMPPAERSRIPRIFAAGVQTLLATDAAAEGLNLHHHCRIVVHYELPWNPARLEQRAGRVDRIGQSKRVHEIALVAASTGERLVLAPLIERGPPAGGTFERSRMLAALTESHVAEAVLSGTALTIRHPAEAAAKIIDAVPADLRQEAIEEAERMARHRDLLRRSPGTGTASPSVFSTMTRWRSRSGLVARSSVSAAGAQSPRLDLVYAIEIDTNDGRRVHADAVAIGIALRAAGIPRATARRLRQIVEPFVRPTDRRLNAVLLSTVAESLDHARRLARAADERLRQRQVAIDHLRRSAARELAQPRLFGRRRTAVESSDVREGHHDGAPAQPDSGLQAEVRLVAAVLRRGRGRHR